MNSCLGTLFDAHRHSSSPHALHIRCTRVFSTAGVLPLSSVDRLLQRQTAAEAVSQEIATPDVDQYWLDT